MSTPTNYDDGGRRLRRRRKQAIDSEAPARVPAEDSAPESAVAGQIDRNTPGGLARHSDLLNKSDGEFPAAGDQRRDVVRHEQGVLPRVALVEEVGPRARPRDVEGRQPRAVRPARCDEAASIAVLERRVPEPLPVRRPGPVLRGVFVLKNVFGSKTNPRSG